MHLFNEKMLFYMLISSQILVAKSEVRKITNDRTSEHIRSGWHLFPIRREQSKCGSINYKIKNK